MVFVVVEGSNPDFVSNLCGRLLLHFSERMVRAVEYMPRGSSPFVRPKVLHPCSHMLLDRIETLEYDSHVLKKLKQIQNPKDELVIVSHLYKDKHVAHGLPAPDMVLYIENPGRDEAALEFVAFAKTQRIKHVRCVKPTDEDVLMDLATSFIVEILAAPKNAI
jgi:hypothetical protein